MLNCKSDIPYWYDKALKPCDCDRGEKGENVDQISSYIGYSDFGYFKYKCRLCGREWCDWLEG